jgi:hypothetical protein
LQQIGQPIDDSQVVFTLFLKVKSNGSKRNIIFCRDDVDFNLAEWAKYFFGLLRGVVKAVPACYTVELDPGKLVLLVAPKTEHQALPVNVRLNRVCEVVEVDVVLGQAHTERRLVKVYVGVDFFVAFANEFVAHYLLIAVGGSDHHRFVTAGNSWAIVALKIKEWPINAGHTRVQF